MALTMANSPLWPVPITTVGRSRGGTVVFVRGGKLHVTCILKSTFRLVPDESMKLTQPEDIVLSDTAYSDNPGSSIRASCETVPFLPRVDVLLTGHACAPLGQSVPSQSVRLAIHRDGGWLLNKTLHVYGERTDTTLEPFERIPIVYERTCGGAGYSFNPHGTGMIPGSSYPNIVHPLDSSAAAGFGPLSYEMRLARLSSGVLPKIIDEQVFELPEGFDEAFFQSAPSDQLLDSLEGNEWIEVDGMHPKHPRLVSRLPGIRAVAKVYGIYPEKPDGVRTITLRPDILRIDADTLHCSVVFRTNISLRDGRSLQTLRIAAGVETEEVTVAHLLTAPPMRGAEPAPESVPPPPPEYEEISISEASISEQSMTDQSITNPQVVVTNPRLSISDEVTAERTLETMSTRHSKPARISLPDIFMDDDTVTHDRPLTRAEMARISALAKQLGPLSGVGKPSSVSEEKSTLALDIDLSDFDSL